MDGDARKSEDSYDSSVSAPHADSGIDWLDSDEGCVSVEGTVGVNWVEGVGVTEDSVGVRDDGVSSDTERSETGGMGDGPGIDSVGDSNDESSISEGVGNEISSEIGDEGVNSSDGSVGEVGVSVVGDGDGVGSSDGADNGDGARSVGVRSDGSLGV